MAAPNLVLRIDCAIFWISPPLRSVYEGYNTNCASVHQNSTRHKTVMDNSVETSSSSIRGAGGTLSTASTRVGMWNHIPIFEESEQLCDSLIYDRITDEKSEVAIRRLRNHDDSVDLQTLPDAPHILLSSGQLLPYCNKDISTPHLDSLGPKLQWSHPSYIVSPLNEHSVQGHNIVITENPSLHIVWADNILYLKPLPAYLTSHAFWQCLLDTNSNTSTITPDERNALIAGSLGFVKSYSSLIIHRSDFLLAQKHNLLPPLPNLTYESLIRFLLPFSTLPNSAVSPRHRVGDLELSAVNVVSVLFRRKWHYHRYKARYSAYFERYFPAVLFLFAVFSVMLSAMQVWLAGKQLQLESSSGPAGLASAAAAAATAATSAVTVTTSASAVVTSSPVVVVTSTGYAKGIVGLFEWFSLEAMIYSVIFGTLFLLWWVVISIADVRWQIQAKRTWKQKVAREEMGNP